MLTGQAPHRLEEGGNLHGFYALDFRKRPGEELYDLSRDPYQLENLARRSEYAGRKETLRATLERWMKKTKDPRAFGGDDSWDRYPYFGAPAPSIKR